QQTARAHPRRPGADDLEPVVEQRTWILLRDLRESGLSRPQPSWFGTIRARHLPAVNGGPVMKATDLLKQQHDALKLFDGLMSGDESDRADLCDELVRNLVAHSATEKEIARTLLRIFVALVAMLACVSLSPTVFAAGKTIAIYVEGPDAGAARKQILDLVP